jgi:hypothetical protein
MYKEYSMAKRTDQPPSFFKLVTIYENDLTSKYLRFGQWFINRFMPNEQNDKLYTTTNKEEALRIIREYYEQYQW